MSEAGELLRRILETGDIIGQDRAGGTIVQLPSGTCWTCSRPSALMPPSATTVAMMSRTKCRL
jgi:hypothetical protein